jgi:hypothetical protein
MPTMKVTPDAAMRARDVSRPHAEHLEWAEEAGAGVTAAVVEADVVVKPGAAAEAGVAAVDIPDPDNPGSEDRPADADRDRDRDRGPDGARRRRVRSFRSSSRRGRPSR